MFAQNFVYLVQVNRILKIDIFLGLLRRGVANAVCLTLRVHYCPSIFESGDMFRNYCPYSLSCLRVYDLAFKLIFMSCFSVLMIAVCH